MRKRSKMTGKTLMRVRTGNTFEVVGEEMNETVSEVWSEEFEGCSLRFG